jgi:lysyl-tRNA synthetase class 2
MELLKFGETYPLNEIKEKSQLSGKKWDKASKTLTKNNLVKVEKTDDVLLVSLV